MQHITLIKFIECSIHLKYMHAISIKKVLQTKLTHEYLRKSLK